ncbi:MAG: hypothetical protein ACTSQJ_08980 [Promethearchaeota archaeon]
MVRRKKKDNFCVICGKLTDDKKTFGKVSDPYPNQFFICENCKKIWCAACMKSILRKSHKETHKLGKKNKVQCPECKQLIPMYRTPVNISFKQSIKKRKKKQPQKIKPEDEAKIQTLKTK